MMTKTIAIRKGMKFLKKTLTVILAGIFLFTNALSFAENDNLAPSLRLNNEEFKTSLAVAAICKHIEHDGNLDDKSYLNDVLARLDVTKNSNITVLPYEVIIEIPSENLAVRYFDPTKASAITPYSDISKLSTKIIGLRLNRQIIHRIKALTAISELEDFEKELEEIAKKLGLGKYLNSGTKFALHIGDNLKVGDPNGSKTHEIFNAALIGLGENIIYLPYEIPENDANRFKQIIRFVAESNRVIGFDTGAPFKLHIQSAIPGLKVLRGGDETGIDFVFKDLGGNIFGGNWNGDAWVKWYESHLGEGALKGKRVMILGGAGPTGASIAISLLERGISKLCIEDADKETGYRVTETLRSGFKNIPVNFMKDSDDGLGIEIAEADIIINATGIGKKDASKSPLTDDIHKMIRQGTRVVDLNYRPNPINAFLEKAKKSGAVIFNGAGLMIYVNSIHTARALIASGAYSDAAFEKLVKQISETMSLYAIQNNLNQGALETSEGALKSDMNKVMALPPGLFGSEPVEDINALLPLLEKFTLPYNEIRLQIPDQHKGRPLTLAYVVKATPPNERYIFPSMQGYAGDYEAIREVHQLIADAGFIKGRPSLQEAVNRFIEQYPGARAKIEGIMQNQTLGNKGKKVNMINVLYEQTGIPLMEYSLLQHAQDEWAIITSLVKGNSNFQQAITSGTLSAKDVLAKTQSFFGNELRSLKDNKAALNFIAHLLLLHDLGKFIVGEEEHEKRSEAILNIIFEGDYLNFSPFEKKLLKRMVGLHSTIENINSSESVKKEFRRIAEETASDGFIKKEALIDIMRVMSMFRIAELTESGHFAFIYEDTFPSIKEAYDTAERVIEEAYAGKSPAIVENQMEYININTPLFKDALGVGKRDVLLRVPVEAIESIEVDNIKNFLSTFQKAPNGYVELYYVSGIGEASESVYQKYGIEKKLLSEELKIPEKRTRKNTLTLFPVLKDEKLDQASIVSRIGNMTPKNTILSPIGLQNDSAGLIRSTILGLKIMEVAREGERIDKDEVQKRVLEDLKMICRIDDMRGLTADDIIYLAVSDDINKIMEALKKLIRLLPITPIDADELRRIYEHAKQALVAA